MTQIAENHGQHELRRTLHLTILNNGIAKMIDIDLEATVKALLDRAIALFGNISAPHTQSLWTEKGAELINEQETLKAAHLKDGETLLLRPGAVKGGQ
jgi:hypothetical protein